MKKVVLHFGKGSLYSGFEAVVAELFLPNHQYPIRVTSSLPAAPAIAAAQQQWQSLYRTRHQNQALRIQLLHQEGSRYSDEAFTAACQQLTTELNTWLRSAEFCTIELLLRTELGRRDEIQIILETWDSQLRKLPWHLWRFFEDYPKAEATLSGEAWRAPSLVHTAARRARLLAVLGDSQTIDTQADFELLRQLPQAELMMLESPSRPLLNEQLWQPQGWDVFFFAGHSQTDGDQGRIYLNEQESLTIPQLKHALAQAIANGLKIAIFNSCDGLGLAQQLSDLQIPYIIVMREPVPDPVAHQFLRHFLNAFAAGATFHLAVREARQRLEGVEGELPCATWLPVVWQNPAAPPLYWRDLCLHRALHQRDRTSDWAGAIAAVGVSALVIAVRALGLLEPLELAAYDRLMRQRPVEPIDSRLIVIEISQEDTSQYGYPLPDQTLAAAVERLTQLQPAAIGMDLHRPQARGPGYDRLMQQFETHPNLFMVCAYGASDRSYEPPVSFSKAQIASQIGFSDLLIDGTAPPATAVVRRDLAAETPQSHQVVRRHLLSYDTSLQPSPSSCTTPYSFSFQLAFEYLWQQGVSPLDVNAEQRWQFGAVSLQELPQRFVGYQALEAQTSQILLNYRSNQPGQRLTLSQVLAGELDRDLIQDHLVMIGYTAPVSRDYFYTPYGSMPGVWIHAHMVSQLVSSVLDQRPLLQALPQWRSWQWGDALWILGWTAGSSAGMVYVRRLGQYGWVVIGLSQLSLYQICLLALARGLWLPWVPTALSLLLAAGWLSAWPRLSSSKPLSKLSAQPGSK
ncbi:MAG: CHASE2 domain-containing protein [Leptolyngbya sp. SIO4C1]|nr:CHASE2 domain-containing protein [Leptolyngbya sp. SIO4C1]